MIFVKQNYHLMVVKIGIFFQDELDEKIEIN
jgi:hypothetical protein